MSWGWGKKEDDGFWGWSTSSSSSGSDWAFSTGSEKGSHSSHFDSGNFFSTEPTRNSFESSVDNPFGKMDHYLDNAFGAGILPGNSAGSSWSSGNSSWTPSKGLWNTSSGKPNESSIPSPIRSALPLPSPVGTYSSGSQALSRPWNQSGASVSYQGPNSGGGQQNNYPSQPSYQPRKRGE